MYSTYICTHTSNILNHHKISRYVMNLYVRPNLHNTVSGRAEVLLCFCATCAHAVAFARSGSTPNPCAYIMPMVRLDSSWPSIDAACSDRSAAFRCARALLLEPLIFFFLICWTVIHANVNIACGLRWCAERRNHLTARAWSGPAP